MRLEALRSRAGPGPGSGPAAARGSDDHGAVGQALLAHLCRCTGWRTIFDAWDLRRGEVAAPQTGRDLVAASRRATLEGGTFQRVGAEVALGAGGFADDIAPPDALVAVPDGRGGWSVGETLTEARRAAGKVQGRRTTEVPPAPLAVPEGEWDVTLQTSWVEPAYLETDASWCYPGGEPAPVSANGGAFGGKAASPLPAVARDLGLLEPALFVSCLVQSVPEPGLALLTMGKRDVGFDIHLSAFDPDDLFGCGN